MGLVRLLLALSVVIGHTKPIFGISLVGGPAAVQAFYVISGFYMALVLNEKYERGTKGYWVFLSSRFLRLYPVYAVIIIMALVLVAAHRVGGESPAAWHTYGSRLSLGSLLLLVGSQVLIFGQDLVMFFGIHPASGSLYLTSNFNRAPLAAWEFLLVPQAWSLGVELWFYLLAPVIVRRSIRVILLVMAGSIATRLFVAFGLGYTGDPWSYRFFPSQLVVFLLGVLGYRVYAYCRQRKLPLARLGGVALAFVVLELLFYTKLRLPSISLCTVAATAISLPAIFALTKSNGFDRFIGDLSYPVYLCHYLLARFLERFTVVTGAKLALTTIAISIVLLVVVDRPVDRLRQRFVDRRKLKEGKPLEPVELIAAP
jgi:peptidoglycan/LPS O-acetylase OafA/YrhL